MARVSPLVILPPVIFAAIAGMFLGEMLLGDGDNLKSAFEGREAPALPTEPLGDKPQLTDDDLRTGEVTLVNYWASWCPPCRLEHPTLLELAESGVRIAGVNFRDLEDDALEYLEEGGDPFFASAFDPRGRTSIDWGVSAPPETFIIDGEGTVLFRFAGPLIGSDYEQRFLPELQKALGQAE